VQCDEIWSFVGSKEKNTTPEKKAEGRGDCWTWTALDADTKLILSFRLGDRTLSTAYDFMHDLSARIANRPIQLTTDGHKVYLEAVESAFNLDIDYAILSKVYRSNPEGETRYSPVVHWLRDQARLWRARPEAHLNVVRRAPESDHADVDATVHPPDECLQQKAGEPRGDGGPILHVLQLRAGASDAPRDACDGSRCFVARMEHRGNR
jgi:IS1 family transposase